jgi:hypothetical protein
MKMPQPPDSLREEKCSGGFAETDALLLETAVEKLVRLGRLVGVSPEEMISLLDSGISIHDLLVFLSSKSSGGTT